MVRFGSDQRRAKDKETGRSTHTLLPVYCEMLAQICRDYATLPNPYALTMREIRFWFEWLRPELHVRTKPKAK